MTVSPPNQAMHIVGTFIRHGVQNKNDSRREGIHNMRSKVDPTGVGVLGKMGERRPRQVEGRDFP